MIAARCEEGLGSPEFTDMLLNIPGAAAFAERLADPDFFAIDQWQLQELCKVLRKARVCLVSEGVEASDSRATRFVDVVPNLSEGLQQAYDRHGETASVIAVPRGPYVLTRCRP